MILIDTSVWIDHLVAPIRHLVALIQNSDSLPILTHPFVIGELACGTFPTRTETIRDLRLLQHAQHVSDDEVLFFIDRHSLMGCGIGLVDIHLLASTLITPGALLWTHDKRLARVAHDLSIAYVAPSIGEE